MFTRTIAFIAVSVFSFFYVSSSDAAGPGIPIRFGWGSEIKTVGSVDPESEVGREMGETRVSVALVWDWLWLALPAWCSDRGYVLYEDVETVTEDTLYWELNDQSKKNVAEITGIPESDLAFPFYAYVPPGWIAVAVLLLVVNLFSGPSPGRRFAKLTGDREYIEALGMMLQPDQRGSDEEIHEDDLLQLEAEAQLRYETAVSYLVSQGVSESKAQRNLQFLIGYLESHPDATID